MHSFIIKDSDIIKQNNKPKFIYYVKTKPIKSKKVNAINNKNFIITSPSITKQKKNPKFIYRIKTKSIKSKSTENESSNRIRKCIDPIMNNNYGCFSKNNKHKISCLLDSLPDTLECLYFGNLPGSYTISNTKDHTYPCDGKGGFNRQEVSRIYGCSSTGGKVSSCDTDKKNFCECPDIKEWDESIDSCVCPEGTKDNLNCCVTDSLSCKKQNEVFDCDTRDCECREGFRRKNDDPLEDCIKYCGKTSQNNPINWSDPQSGASGCGSLELHSNFGEIGTTEDHCCDEDGDLSGKSGTCVLDLGNWDGNGPIQGKNQCLLNNGFWKITTNNTCPRKGHCEYTNCSNSFVQASEPLKMYTSSCDLKCSEDACKNACTIFTNNRNTTMKKSECFNNGTPPACLCYTNDWI